MQDLKKYRRKYRVLLDAMRYVETSFIMPRRLGMGDSVWAPANQVWGGLSKGTLNTMSSGGQPGPFDEAAAVCGTRALAR